MRKAKVNPFEVISNITLHEPPKTGGLLYPLTGYDLLQFDTYECLSRGVSPRRSQAMRRRFARERAIREAARQAIINVRIDRINENNGWT